MLDQAADGRRRKPAGTLPSNATGFLELAGWFGIDWTRADNRHPTLPSRRRRCDADSKKYEVTTLTSMT
jgi:hypothetical protein